MERHPRGAVTKTEQADLPSQSASETKETSSETTVAKSKLRAKGKSKTKDSPRSLQWQMLSNAAKPKSNTPLLTFVRGHFFQLLGTFSLVICAILFTFQAYLAFRSFQMMNQLHKRPQIPEMLYRIYFEGHDWAMNSGRVDLRANTSIFVH